MFSGAMIARKVDCSGNFRRFTSVGRFCKIHGKNDIFQKPDRILAGLGSGIQSAKDIIGLQQITNVLGEVVKMFTDMIVINGVLPIARVSGLQKGEERGGCRRKEAENGSSFFPLLVFLPLPPYFRKAGYSIYEL